MPEHVRWGILSTAAIAVNAFIPAVRQTRRGVVVAVASRDAARARDFAARHGIPQAYGSYAEMLASAEIDAVYNPLPNSLHAEWTMAAARHGRHVFCEKPLAVSAAEAMQMCDACAAAGVVFFEAFVFLYHPQSLRLREVLDSGTIGPVRQLQMSFTFPLRRPTENIRMSREMAGGSLMDVGCYAITFARFVMGAEPVAVQAAVRMDPDYGVDTLATMVLEFPGERHASLQAGFDAAGGQRATVHGESGFVEIPHPCHPPEEAGFTVHAAGQSERVTVNTGGRPFVPAVEHFQDCVLDGAAPLVTASYAAGTLRTIEAVRESAATGRRVRLA